MVFDGVNQMLSDIYDDIYKEGNRNIFFLFKMVCYALPVIMTNSFYLAGGFAFHSHGVTALYHHPLLKWFFRTLAITTLPLQLIGSVACWLIFAAFYFVIPAIQWMASNAIIMTAVCLYALKHYGGVLYENISLKFRALMNHFYVKTAFSKDSPKPPLTQTLATIIDFHQKVDLSDSLSDRSASPILSIPSEGETTHEGSLSPRDSTIPSPPESPLTLKRYNPEEFEKHDILNSTSMKLKPDLTVAFK